MRSQTVRLLFSLLLVASVAYGFPTPAGEVTPSVFAKSAENAKAEIGQQVDVITDFWGGDPDAVRCLSIYLDAPAWMNYDIQLNMQSDDPGFDACIKREVKWRAVVAGADYLPRDLAVSVGYDDYLLTGNFSTTASYSTSDGSTPDELNFDDYGSAPAPVDRSHVDTQALWGAVAVCALKTQGSGTLPFPLPGQTKQTFAQCLSNIPVSGLPPFPPPPPPPPPQKGKFRKFATGARDFFNLAPFVRTPQAFPGSKRPYKLHNTAQNTANKVDYHTYVMPEGMCDNPFKQDRDFTPQPLGTGQNFDSCYYTQTIVYIYYPGTCMAERTNPVPTPIKVTGTLTATYNSFNKCNKNPMFALGKALQVVLWTTGIPAGLFMLFLMWPTIWRLFYRGWLYVTFACSTKGRKRKQRLRMQMDAPLRWGWLLRLQARPGVRDIILVRKRLIYACLTMKSTQGRNRLLMMVVLATVTIFVSIMVWRPHIRIVLNSNPNKVTLQLEDVNGPYGKLARYFQIVGASLYMGCIAYMSLLTNANAPDEEDAKRYYNKLRGFRLPPPPAGGTPAQGKLRQSDPGIPMNSYSSPSAAAAGKLPYLYDPKDSVTSGSAPSTQYPSSAALLYRGQGPVAEGTEGVMGGPPDLEVASPGVKRNKVVEWASRLKMRSDQWTSWEVQKAMSMGFSSYLVFLLILQIANVAAFLSITDNSGAYVWILIIQIFNIAALCVIQLQDWILVEHDALVKYLGAEAPRPTGLTACMVWLRECFTRHEKPPQSRSSSDGGAGSQKGSSGGAAAGGGLGQELIREGMSDKERRKAKQAAKKAAARKNWLLRLYRGDMTEQDRVPGMTKKEVKRARKAREAAETEYSLWQQFKMIMSESVGEEMEEIKWQGSTIKTYTFKYPAWFLAAIATAFYMLIFHYIKSLDFGQKLGYCVISWSECEITWIRNIANNYNLQQLAIIRSAAIRVDNVLSGLQPGAAVIDQLLFSLGVKTTLSDLRYTLSRVNTVLEPGNSPRSVWVHEYGQKLAQTATTGYTIGLALGILTLCLAVISFKRIAKAHRLLVLTRRLLEEPVMKRKSKDGAAGDGDEDDEDDFDPNITMVANKVQLVRVAALQSKGTIARGAARPRKATRGSDDGGQTISMTQFHKMVNTTTTSPPKGGKPGQAAQKSLAALSDSETDLSSDDDQEVREPEAFNVTTLAAFRAFNVPISQVVFFLGVLLSSTVVQLYTVGIVLTAIFAFVMSSYFWDTVVQTYWPYLLMFIVVIILNKVALVALVGNRYITDGKKIKRPAGWFAFVTIASVTNLVVGLFIAIIRLVWLVLSSIFTVGLLDRTILTIGQRKDAPYNAFLAGIHLRDGVGLVDKRALTPGKHWRSVKRWRAAIRAVKALGPEGYLELERRNQFRAEEKNGVMDSTPYTGPSPLYGAQAPGGSAPPPPPPPAAGATASAPGGAYASPPRGPAPQAPAARASPSSPPTSYPAGGAPPPVDYRASRLGPAAPPAGAPGYPGPAAAAQSPPPVDYRHPRMQGTPAQRGSPGQGGPGGADPAGSPGGAGGLPRSTGGGLRRL